MARGTPGRGSAGRKSITPQRKPFKNKKAAAQEEEPFGLDEVDAFHKQRDKVSLAVSEDERDSDEDSELDAAAYDLEHGESSDYESADSGEDESEEEEEDEDAALQAAIKTGGRLGRLAKQAQAVGARVKLQQGEDDDEEERDEAEDELEKRRAWGANKRAYHGADELTDDEEAAAEEEAEALRLQAEQQAALRPEDYDDSHMFPDAEGSENEEAASDAEAEPTLGQVADQAQNGGVRVERIARDLPANLDKQAALAIIDRDAPELLALLEELKGSLEEVRSRVGPVLAQVKSGELATEEGVSYLEAKHLLLLNYCTHIVFYVLLKAEGVPVRTHPVIGRLLQLRTYLEKLRPIDKKLAYQIDKLLAAGAKPAADATAAAENGGTGVEVDPLSYGPRPDQLVPRLAPGNELADGGAGNGLYRPPRLAAVAMDEADDPDRRRSAKERRREREASRRAGRSALLQELAQEVEGAPEELSGGVLGTEAGMDSASARRQLHSLAARAAVEEDLMMRVPLSKEQRKSLKANRRAAMSGKGLGDEFADDVADLVAAAEGVSGRSLDEAGDFSRRRLVSQQYGGNAAVIKPRSGDEDLPLREPLHERRAKFDNVRARQSAADDSGGGGKRQREEDVTYQAAAAATAAKKKARKEARAVPETLPPLPDPMAEGARKINTAIEKNRGLTPHRNKAGKNPRKKNRTKFEKAQVRRGGQVQAVREKTAGYGGEATGIKANISRSRRF